MAGGGNVVITDCDHTDVLIEREILEAAGHKVELLEWDSLDDLVRGAKAADAVITQYAPITAQVLDQLPRCRVVVRYGVGYDNVDVEAATTRGMWVANVPDYGIEEVADHTLALMLSLLRKIVALYDSVREGVWKYRVAEPLHPFSTQTIGVVGCGRIGSLVAERVRCLGARALVVDPIGIPESLRAIDVHEATFDEILETCDVVSLHLPLSDTTRHLISAGELERMKPSSFLINTSRGALVDQVALVEALDNGVIAGAGLDVLEGEPPNDISVLAKHRNVIVTPHTAWYSERAYANLKRGVAQEVVRVLDGEVPRAAVNEPSRGASHA